MDDREAERARDKIRLQRLMKTWAMGDQPTVERLIDMLCMELHAARELSVLIVERERKKRGWIPT
jgi:hypothetical protein